MELEEQTRSSPLNRVQSHDHTRKKLGNRNLDSSALRTLGFNLFILVTICSL